MEQVVSVIVPVYNTAKYLEKCLDSLISQTYKYLQIILVDDGSTDNSSTICDVYANKDDRIQVIHQANKGVSTARNTGMDAINGDYLLFVDSDDSLTSETVEMTVKAFNDPTIDMVAFGIKRIDNGTGVICELPMETGVFSQKEMLYGVLNNYSGCGGGYPCNKMWRISSFGGKDHLPRFAHELYYFEDLEWVVRMLLRIQQAKLLSDHFYHYNIHPESITHKAEAQEHREIGYHRSIEKVIHALKREPEIYEWFRFRYYPEIVNGVIHSCKYRYITLRLILLERLQNEKQEILSSPLISRKIRFRCHVVSLMDNLHIL